MALTIGKYLLVTLLLVCNPVVIQACSISSGWEDLSMEERLILSEIVVYGQTVQHQANIKVIDDKRYTFIDAVFEVYCILKSGDHEIAETIVIESISPRNGCSGTKEYKQIGRESIIGLKPTADGKYEYDEVMPTQSAAFEASRNNLFSVSQICNLQSWAPPLDAEINRCPICGTANFTAAVLEVSASKLFDPCIFSDINLGGTIDCELFETPSADNSSVCMATDFGQTCSSFVLDRPSVNCTCVKDSKNFNFTPFGDTDAGLVNVPAVQVLVAGFVAVCMLI